MRLILACLLSSLLASCVEQPPYAWSGIPLDVTRACAWDRDGHLGTCIAAGRAYQCVSPANTRTVTCALVSPVTPAEMPK